MPPSTNYINYLVTAGNAGDTALGYAVGSSATGDADPYAASETGDVCRSDASTAT